MENIEKIIMANFYSDYDRLTGGLFKEVVCLMGIGHNRNVFYDPQAFLIKDKDDFSFGKVQILLERFRNVRILLGIELAFIDWNRFEEGLRRIYEIFNEQIRCV